MNCLIITLLLCLLHRSKAFVTVVVELDPHYTSTTPPACSPTFVANFESNLTAWVMNATRSISLLSDFTVPGGFHLTYQNTARRQLQDSRELTLTRATNAGTCTRCTSASCKLSCGIGVCNLCAGSRRRTEESSELETGDELEATGERPGGRMLTADWSTVGVYVSNAVEPQIIYYAAVNAGDCLGNYNVLGVNVTFVSNVVLDATMDSALIAAFGAPAPAPPPNTAQACCTLDFANCINWCGTTQQQCETCTVLGLGWLPVGAPAPGSCTSRWGYCGASGTGCCPGLQCLGDQYWKGCFYVPRLPLPTVPSAPAPTTTPVLRPPSSPPTPLPTQRPTAQPTSAPVASTGGGGGWWWCWWCR